MNEPKWREIQEEFRAVLGGRGNLLDVAVPPLLFALANALWGLPVAAGISVGAAMLLAVVRLGRQQSLTYALGGLGAVLLAALLAWLSGRAEGYFLPTIASTGLTIVACVVSALVKRPLVAWASHLARGWPWTWYWHPRVRPAYTEVTWAWAVYSALRLLLQWLFFTRAAAGWLAVLSVLTGWPATVLLLIATYLYGTWRLRMLQGPSVEEFEENAPSPWTGQQRGF